MNLSEKLRSAARSPESWDVPGLLEDAAQQRDDLLAACKAFSKAIKDCRDRLGAYPTKAIFDARSLADAAVANAERTQQPLTRAEMIAEARDRR